MNSLGYAEIALVVADAERSARFYIDVVGYELAEYDPGPGARLIKVGPDHYLGLWEPNVWGAKRRPFEGRYGAEFRQRVGQAHLVFAIHQDEVRPLAERLVRAGYSVHGPEVHQDGSLHLYASDPDDHAMEWWGRQP
ncbi:MAG: VOC family protein [Chloroflexi bacterium]|nr:VOC family protein [Chloroflexota bacterium]